jgi:VWFA-related protein
MSTRSSPAPGRRSRRPWPRTLFVAAASFVLAWTIAGARQEQPAAQERPARPAASGAPTTQAPPRPTFRVEANLVRVDAIVTKDGQAVRDLAEGDFEVLEDGAPQKLASFEHVEITETRLTRAPGREPNTVAEAREMAADPRNRVFVVFLDRYHTTIAGSHRMQRALARLFDRVIGPDDLVAVMTPEMSAPQIAFTRRTASIDKMLFDNWAWGVRDQITTPDPVEQSYEACFPSQVPPGATAPPPSKDPMQPAGTPAGMMEGGRAPVKDVAQEMISRRREKQTLDALTDLAVYLRGVRDERKAVLIVSDGWALYRPDERLTRLREGERVPGAGVPGVDPQGRLVPDRRSRYEPPGATSYDCEVARQQLAMLDNRQTFLDLMDYANRGNVTFYPVDSRGLPVFDTSIAETFVTPSGGRSILPPNVDQRQLTQRIETLRTLADNTDGIAVVNNNDIEKGLERVVADLTSYYLMSYYSTNGTADGKYRRIDVRVKRPGVEVRARKGYRAASAAEMTSAASATATVAPTAVQLAFAQLGSARADLPLRTHVAHLSAVTGTRVFAAVELDARTLRLPEWSGAWKAEFTLTDGSGAKVVARTTADGVGVPAARAEVVFAPDEALAPGDYVVRTRVTPSGSGLPLSDAARFSVSAEQAPTGSPTFARRNATTGRAYARTADLRFRRTDWLRVALPLSAPATSVSAELVDQRGQTMSVPVTGRAEETEAGAVAIGELSLAPLAAGEYAVRLVIDLAGTKVERIIAFRVVT